MTGSDELASLERDCDRLRVGSPSDVKNSIRELLAAESNQDRIILLNGWVADFPHASSQLLSVIARDAAVAFELAPAVLTLRGADPSDVDSVMAAAFARLHGPLREAAAERPGVRAVLGIAADFPKSVPAPDPSWLWPRGIPFPPADTVEGVQARLNYLDLGAGPVNGEWSEITRRAFVRWQVLHGYEPTGELDWPETDHLGELTPEAPE